jgi:cysteine desulfurase
MKQQILLATLILLIVIIFIYYRWIQIIAPRPGIYLDNNGTTRIFDESLKMMEHIYKNYYGNASGIYELGAKSKRLLEHCREIMAKMLNCDTCEMFFTSGATESNNIAIRGIYSKHKERGKHIITSSIEHPSVYETVKSLEGADTTFLPVDRFGKINLRDLESAIRKDTILVTVIMGNNEIGTIQDIKAISAICKKKSVHFHCDMTQIIGKYLVDLKDLGVNSATGSGHKFHGPKATGFLYLQTESYFETCVTGGGQEKNIRAGTENIPGIISMCYSLHLCHKFIRDNKHLAIKQKRDWMKQMLVTNIPDAVVNGHPIDIMYNTLSLCLPVNSRKLINMLDKQHISINTGSACSKGHSSKVLDAVGVDPKLQEGSVRISLGFLNTWDDCVTATRYIIDYVNKLKKIII